MNWEYQTPTRCAGWARWWFEASGRMHLLQHRRIFGFTFWWEKRLA